MNKLKSLILILPVAFFSVGLTTGCGGGKGENVVIEAAPTTVEEEATYEQETVGSLDDDSQN